jgi:hypothetical protein
VDTQAADNTTYINVYYIIKITRKPGYYITTFMWPAFLITSLSIMGVFSPFNESGEREEKVTMGLTTLLTMAVILMIITNEMPKSSAGMPLLGKKMLLSSSNPQFGQVVLTTIPSAYGKHLRLLFVGTLNICSFPNCKDRATKSINTNDF